ncbi:chitinase-like protein 10 [Leptotrombidium deliense]|uniref:Chitinase-like protein 10 n=1 Tax=Leptotrombidium deliense TaxID=299467 RepID=A0A443SRJ0_9ACAR|nr:chitinase-like protein 10 [Leptotrombidium deliense]
MLFSASDLLFLNSLKSQNPKLKVLVSLRFDRKAVANLISANSSRSIDETDSAYSRLAIRVRDFIVAHEIDGVDLDSKYLTDNEILSVNKEIVTSFTKALRYAFQERNSVNIKPKEFLISITSSKYPKELADDYNFKEIKK